MSLHVLVVFVPPVLMSFSFLSAFFIFFFLSFFLSSSSSFPFIFFFARSLEDAPAVIAEHTRQRLEKARRQQAHEAAPVAPEAMDLSETLAQFEDCVTSLSAIGKDLPSLKTGFKRALKQ